jgi:DNA invertase Pin-like site-specific DNA recombinase
MSKPPPPRRAFSYIRLSHPAQIKGGGVKRQLAKTLDYCKRHHLVLDEKLSRADLGVSSFHGENASQGELAGILEAIRLGTIPAGSVLIIESVDRISRQGIDEGYDLCKKILKSGVFIVTLTPEREYGPEAVKALTKGALELQIILERAHEESLMKSDRRQKAWKQAKDRARQASADRNGTPLMKTCPAWLEVTKTGFRIKEEAAAAVRLIFEMACDNLGVHRIADRLNDKKVPPIGTSGHWVAPYVYLILANQAAMGTYQPKRHEGKKAIPDGAPIPNFYPAVVTEAQWHVAQAAMQRRSHGKGAGRKGGEETNLFTGMLREATTGARMIIINALGNADEHGQRKRYRYLCATKPNGTPAKDRIDYAVFEQAVLALFEELEPADIAAEGKHTNGRKAEIARLSGRLLDIDSRLERARERAKTAGDFDAFLDLIADLQAERKQVSEDKAELERAEDGRAVADLGEAHSLIDLLKGAAVDRREDLRCRLKGRIQQLLSGAWLVLVRHGRKCLCGVQLWFRESNKRRDYLILHKPGTRYGAGGWRVWSLADVTGKADLDLRKQADARKLEEVLNAVNVNALWELARED